MSIISVTTDLWQANRARTLATLDAIGQLPNPPQVLGWRPGPGRAHIAWQLMHVGVTEELFATARILETEPAWPDLVARFRGGSTPDDVIPSVDEIRQLLDESRAHLLDTIAQFGDGDLDDVPAPLKERGWSLGTVLKVLAWHEPHHQGQAHITLNLWKAGTFT
jgi:uncharacterized damage-inducible protein DinB